MHEFALCEGIVNIILTELNKVDPPATRILTTRLTVGALHQIIPQNMVFAYEVLTKETPAVGSKLEIKTIPIMVRCKDCGNETMIEDNMYVCKKCQSGKLDIIAGKELFIEDLEVE